MFQKLFFFLFFTIVFSCSDKQKTFSPIEKITIGASKNEVNKILKYYKNNNVIGVDNTFMLNGQKVKLSLVFCSGCFNDELQAIKLKAQNNSELIKTIQASTNYDAKRIKIKELELKDLILDTLVCVYSNKMKYYTNMGVLACKRIPTEPCWK